MNLYKYSLSPDDHSLTQEMIPAEEKSLSYSCIIDSKRRYIRKSSIDIIDPETDTLFSLKDDKAFAAQQFIDLFSKRKEVYDHAAECMNSIAKSIIKEGMNHESHRNQNKK